jgi:hypothetical protein
MSQPLVTDEKSGGAFGMEQLFSCSSGLGNSPFLGGVVAIENGNGSPNLRAKLANPRRLIGQSIRDQIPRAFLALNM